MSGWRFHAAAPAGEWLNDPNGLAWIDGRCTLFAQHSVHGPSGGEVGWGSFASDDLLHWRWQGVAIAPDDRGSAYSGCLVDGGSGVEAFFTRHHTDGSSGGPHQTQHRAFAPDWREQAGELGPNGRNCRDPFVFFSPTTRDWRMLVAEPCDWHGWAPDGRSHLGVWRSDDRVSWRRAGGIGPWHPPGVMWEVPALIDFGAHHALIVSLVDRRAGRATCSVRYWVGRFEGVSFTISPSFPPEGLLLDHGPDFYAAMPNLVPGWPDQERVIVAWASNWDDARGRNWTDGARGGPITMPRTVTLADGVLRQRPIAAAAALVHATVAFGDELAVEGMHLSADRGLGTLTVRTERGQSRSRVDWLGSGSSATLFRDGELLELFIDPEGVVVTAARVG